MQNKDAHHSGAIHVFSCSVLLDLFSVLCFNVPMPVCIMKQCFSTFTSKIKKKLIVNLNDYVF